MIIFNAIKCIQNAKAVRTCPPIIPFYDNIVLIFIYIEYVWNFYNSHILIWLSVSTPSH